MSPLTSAAFLALLICESGSRPSLANDWPSPRVFLLDASILSQHSHHRVAGRGGDDPLALAARQEADQAIREGPFSVMQKTKVPPSGDKHDYMSQAPYWWPDPQSTNGLPYIRRDGERNPEIRKISDHERMGRMSRVALTLALGYYLTGNQAYATRAALLLRTWFLDPATLMKPALDFAQAVPGVNNGRSTGIIESRDLTTVVDAVGLLAGAKAWQSSDQKGVEQWFRIFLKWLQDSPNGRGESSAQNNHGTYYDVQVVDFALLVGDRNLAERTLREAPQRRIAAQVEPDGRQPRELARTRSFSYSVMNLRGLMDLAQLGRVLGVDLWNFQTADGRGIRKALDFLVPYATGEKKWEYEQISEFNPPELVPLLLKAQTKYADGRYDKVVQKLGPSAPGVEVLLLRDALPRFIR